MIGERDITRKMVRDWYSDLNPKMWFVWFSRYNGAVSVIHEHHAKIFQEGIATFWHKAERHEPSETEIGRQLYVPKAPKRTYLNSVCADGFGHEWVFRDWESESWDSAFREMNYVCTGPSPAYHPEISCDTVYAFDRLGRKELHPKLLISDSPGAKKLRRLPYTAQEKYSDNPVPLLVRTDKGWDTLKASVFNLTSEQANQVFDADGIRTDAAQRTWLECKTSKAIIQVDDAWRVSGRKLIVMQPCQFTAGQLARMLADMES